jgi:hypothetical protein
LLSIKFEQGRAVQELSFDLEIEKTAKANQKAIRLARLAKKVLTEAQGYISSDVESIYEEVMAEPSPPRPPRRTMGDYCRRTDIKTTALADLRDKQFDGKYY